MVQKGFLKGHAVILSSFNCHYVLPSMIERRYDYSFFRGCSVLIFSENGRHPSVPIVIFFFYKISINYYTGSHPLTNFSFSNMSLLKRIANNDPTLKEISLGDSADKYFHDVSEMVAALGSNTVIDYVRVDREFLPSLLGQPEKKAAVVNAIGKLPALRELRIMSGPVHANVLGIALTDAVNLENLELVRRVDLC